MSRVYVLLLAVLLVSCVGNPVVFQAFAQSTEADFRAMKIKELRVFLEVRGLSCAGCQEKSDFVRVAFQNRDKKPGGSSPSRRPPNMKLWDAWSENARNICKEAVNRRGEDASQLPFSSVCDTVGQAVDSFFMQHGKRIATRLKKTPDHMLKTSYKDVYYDAGIIYLKRLISKCLASSLEKCESLGYVMNRMEDTSTDFNTWLTNVGIENTNPMYEIIHGNNDGDL